MENEYSRKFTDDYAKLSRVTSAHGDMGDKIVVTIGSWDVLHIGHVRYLIKAKSHGNILVVGVDTDRAIKLYKGPLRPVIPQNERAEMLTYQIPVDLVTFVDDVDDSGNWQFGLIDKIRPDVFIAVENSYPEEQQRCIQELCDELIVLPRQAENTSTSKMIQNTVKGHLQEMIKFVDNNGGRQL